MSTVSPSGRSRTSWCGGYHLERRQRVAGEAIVVHLHGVDDVDRADWASPRSSTLRCSSGSASTRVRRARPAPARRGSAGRSETIASMVSAEAATLSTLMSPRRSACARSASVAARASRPRQSREQLLAARRQQQAAAGPLEQLEAELVLEAADLPRQRRLRDVENLGSLRDGAVLGHRHEGPETLQIHACFPVKPAIVCTTKAVN